MLKEKIIFVVVGRLGKNLIVSKVLPLAELLFFDHIFIFSEEPGFVIGKAEYICLPEVIAKCRIQFLKKILRVIYEPLQLIYYSFKYKPAFINGIYTNPKGVNSWIASKLIGANCIISVIGGQPEIETSFKNKKISIAVNLFLLKRCFKVFTKGQKDNQYFISKGLSSDKLVIFNGAVDINRFCYRNENKDIDLIYVGYFDDNKGPDRFINICRKIISENGIINVLMLGTGPLFPAMSKYIGKIGLSGVIKLMGKKNDVESYLKRSKVMILPSRSEGLSTAMLEAMACGCVPVVSDVGNNREAAHHGINSFLINDYEDINGYANFTTKLLSDLQLWKKLSGNAIDAIRNIYSPEAQAKLLLNVFSNSDNGY
jgi:glycosyltransferase involved in cell wall biosynthesis